VHTLGCRLTRDGAPRGAGDDLRGVDDDLAPDDVDPEAVEAAGSGAAAVFAVDRVLRPVARALEPLGGVAERDAAAEAVTRAGILAAAAGWPSKTISQKKPSALKIGFRLWASCDRMVSASPTVILEPRPPPPLGHR